MVRVASLFSQLLSELPRSLFGSLVNEYQAEYAAKGFTCWQQLVSMLFAHLAAADSLREICNGLRCCTGKLSHLGVSAAPKRSTLSYANEHRPHEVYRDFFFMTLDRMRRTRQLGPRQHKFRFKNKLLSLDSTTISLCLSLFPWVRFRRSKGGIKAHVLLDHDDYLPSYVLITDAKHSDLKAARLLRLVPGSIVAVDKGYIDYRLFRAWDEQGVYFVTRQKQNAAYRVLERRALPRNRNILHDEIIELTSTWGSSKHRPRRLRRVVVWDREQGREIVLLTNHLEFGASTIAAIYKERWQIEIFFKTLKQNLKIKTFVGTTENAVQIQIWTALLALLLLKWLHYLSKANLSLPNLASLLRLNLFSYRDLRAWLDDPFQTPPLEPTPEQLQMAFG